MRKPFNRVIYLVSSITVVGIFLSFWGSVCTLDINKMNHMKVESDFNAISMIINMYEQKFGYPLSESDSLNHLATPEIALAKRIPQDPWGGFYQYKRIDADSFILLSLGSIKYDNAVISLYKKKNGNYVQVTTGESSI